MSSRRGGLVDIEREQRLVPRNLLACKLLDQAWAPCLMFVGVGESHWLEG